MSSSAFSVECPVCRAVLTVSPQARAVVGHQPAPAPPPAADMDTALQALSNDSHRREELFHQAVESEKARADRLKKSFDDLLQSARDNPDTPPPLRDMDLD